MPGENHLKKLVRVVEEASAGLNNSIPGIQRDIMDELELLLRELQLFQGIADPRKLTTNLKIVGNIKSKLERIILNPDYKNQVGDYLKAFDEVSRLQKAYFIDFENFSETSPLFRKNGLLYELQMQSVDAAVQSLTTSGVNAQIISPIQDLLRKNVTTGVSYGDMMRQLRNFIQGHSGIDGTLQKYVKGYATDALNQFASQYMDIVSNDLGLNWFVYSGVEMSTSRDFCIAMVKKRFYHRKELPQLLKGDFKEFKEIKGKIYDRTGLPQGMFPGTNVENFPVYRGGYQCHHQPQPVPEETVPRKVRVAFYELEGIRYDKNGFAV